MAGWLDRTIQKIVKQTVEETIDEQIGLIVRERLAKMFAEQPNRELTDIGFRWACFFALREHWPDVDEATAVHWMLDYIDVKIGTEGYDWTYSAAQEIAREMVGEIGEVA